MHCQLWIGNEERGHRPAFRHNQNPSVGLSTLSPPRGPFWDQKSYLLTNCFVFAMLNVELRIWTEEILTLYLTLNTWFWNLTILKTGGKGLYLEYAQKWDCKYDLILNLIKYHDYKVKLSLMAYIHWHGNEKKN